MFSKSKYIPRYCCWRIVRGVIQLVDAICSLLVAPFGYDCNLYANFAANELKKDVARARAKREVKQSR